MSRARVLIKLGGSILTNKGAATTPRFRAPLAARLAKALAEVHASLDMAIILGAGSWGHPQALRHGVGRRVLRGSALRAAQSEIGDSIRRLHQRFCAAALRAGLPVVPLAAATFAGPSSWDVAPLKWMLDQRLVPVTGGDVVADARKGLRILSGDEIARRLVGPLSPRRVIFATDVPGVLLEGAVARVLRGAEVDDVLARIPQGDDATGGMHGKLQEAKAILDQGVQVRIVDGRRPEAVARAARGRAEGTLLRP